MGPAIGYIIIGSTMYKFRKKLGLPAHEQSERIGFAFWWGGWFAFVWSIFALWFDLESPYDWFGLAAAILWAGFTGLKVAHELLHNKSEEAEDSQV